MSRPACPYCQGRMTEEQAALPHFKPKADDFFLCTHCLSFSVFTDRLVLRIPDQIEQSEIDGNFNLQRIRQHLKHNKNRDN